MLKCMTATNPPSSWPGGWTPYHACSPARLPVALYLLWRRQAITVKRRGENQCESSERRQEKQRLCSSPKLRILSFQLSSAIWRCRNDICFFLFRNGGKDC